MTLSLFLFPPSDQNDFTSVLMFTRPKPGLSTPYFQVVLGLWINPLQQCDKVFDHWKSGSETFSVIYK